MATASLTAPRSFLRPKHVAFAFIAVMTAYVLKHNESWILDKTDPVRIHYAQIARYLTPHGIAGAIALILAPFQFSDRLRAKYRKFHRVAGRVYVAGVFIAAPMGAYIQYWNERVGGPRSFTMLGVTDAVLWISTTAIALFFAMRGQIPEHRRWMTRSYAVALVFFEGRFLSGITGLDHNLPLLEAIIWVCLVFAVFIGDLAIQIQEMPKKRALAKTQTV